MYLFWLKIKTDDLNSNWNLVLPTLDEISADGRFHSLHQAVRPAKLGKPQNQNVSLHLTINITRIKLSLIIILMKVTSWMCNHKLLLLAIITWYFLHGKPQNQVDHYLCKDWLTIWSWPQSLKVSSSASWHLALAAHPYHTGQLVASASD